jgi:hypothetical protein
MLSNLGVKSINSQGVLTLQELKMAGWQNQMQKSFASAHGTITVDRLIFFYLYLPTHCSAVTAALVLGHNYIIHPKYQTFQLAATF